MAALRPAESQWSISCFRRVTSFSLVKRMSAPVFWLAAKIAASAEPRRTRIGKLRRVSFTPTGASPALMETHWWPVHAVAYGPSAAPKLIDTVPEVDHTPFDAVTVRVALPAPVGVPEITPVFSLNV